MNNTSENLQRVEKAMDTMRRAMVGARERLGEGLQLTRTQIEILLMLVDTPRTTGELARKLFLTGSAVTQTIDTLVRRELIERHTDDQDRRIVRLELSATGLEMTNHLCDLRHKSMKALVSKLTETEVNVLVSVTEKMTALIEETKSISKES